MLGAVDVATGRVQELGQEVFGLPADIPALNQRRRGSVDERDVQVLGQDLDQQRFAHAGRPGEQGAPGRNDTAPWPSAASNSSR